ncbi:MAG: LysE family translocator [Candidatus Marinarcus sp.]|uniref:LysE family translocator n=1 Tax=Candidatus Marinarcus sp. TaxID=3100987 RepID=UPI003B00F92D
MNSELFFAYAVVALFYITSPGPAIFLAIANGLRTDMKTVALASFGNILGLFILSTAAILGLGVLLTTSMTLFIAVKVIGAAYLIYLGIKFLRNKGVITFDAVEKNYKIKSKKAYFYEAFFLAVTNPKPILFFTAIFPQFLDTQRPIAEQFFIMTFLFLTISFCSLCTYASLAKKSKVWLSNKNRMNWFNKITGGLFITMGVGLLQLKNHN